MSGLEDNDHLLVENPATNSARAAALDAGPFELVGQLAGIAAEVAALGTAVTPARPDFVRRLGTRFERAAMAASADALQLAAGAAPRSDARPDAPLSLRPDARIGLRARLAAPRLRWLVPAAVTAVAALAVAVLTPQLTGQPLPQSMDRLTLVERNAQAWSNLGTLSGAFETGDGWYYEEWISRAGDGAVRFKRYIRPPARTPNRPQWNVSDGHTEWVIDAGSGDVRVTRDAVPGDFTAVAPNDSMQCTSLVLPPSATEGPPPTPLVVEGRAVYRLSDTLADGAVAIYWLDASDSLVWRIDRPGLGTVWQRRDLTLDQYLPVELFRPDSLANL